LKFKPGYQLDEQMYYGGEVTLLHQIRELLKEQNELLKELKPKEVGETNEKQQLSTSKALNSSRGDNKHKPVTTK
jgi:hypothetical protein